MPSSKKRINKSDLRIRRKGISIGEFPIIDLNALSELEYFPGIKLWCAVTMVIILNMVQIRSALNSVPASIVDRSPSYRYYKARFLRKDEVQGFLISLGICQIAPFMEADPGLLNYTIQQYLDCGAGGNSPYIEKPTETNYEKYFHGVVSRMAGLINSCPSTNGQTFNFPPGHLTFTLKDILEALPFSDGPTSEEVRDQILEMGLDSQDSVILEENPLFFPGGNTPLEKDIFGDKLKRVPQSSISLGKASTLQDNRINRAALERVLSPLEMLQYDKSVGTNPIKLKALSEKAAALLAQESLNNKVGNSLSGTTKKNPSDPEGKSSNPTPPAIQASSGPSKSGLPDTEKKDSTAGPAPKSDAEKQVSSQADNSAGGSSASQQAPESASSGSPTSEASGPTKEAKKKKKSPN